MTPSQNIREGVWLPARCSEAVYLRVTTMKHRKDFLNAARGLRVVKPGFILQVSQCRPQDVDGLRYGVTCSKKVGNAVARNRAKRRLRELARLWLPTHGQDGLDYVLVGRHAATAEMRFDRLQDDFLSALESAHKRLP